jgi:hypothetical protein
MLETASKPPAAPLPYRIDPVSRPPTSERAIQLLLSAERVNAPVFRHREIRIQLDGLTRPALRAAIATLEMLEQDAKRKIRVTRIADTQGSAQDEIWERRQYTAEALLDLARAVDNENSAEIIQFGKIDVGNKSGATLH